MTDFTVINLLREAIALAGDGGPTPFTDNEYDAMYEFLNRQEEIVRQLAQQNLNLIQNQNN